MPSETVTLPGPLAAATEHQPRARVALGAALAAGPAHAYLFRGPRGTGTRAAARKVDETIRKLPGFGSVRLLDAWLDRFHEGGRNGDCNN